MADISKIKLPNNNVYNIKDKTARQQIDLLTLDTMVVFGDSWSDLNVTDSIWSTYASNTLNLTLKNYAVNASTFVANPNNLISTQIQTFTNDTTVNKNKVKFVVFMGGLNDYLQNVDRGLLASTIATSITTLKNLCPKAKIIYVSNCGYPYSLAQSNFWYDVNNFLSTSISAPSLNLDGIIGKALWNSDNYYHLTQNGQKWLAKQVVSTLTGGEITYFNDSRTFTSESGSLTYTAQRIKDFANISIVLTSNVQATSFTFSFPDEVAIPYSNVIFGGCGANVNILQVGTASNAIAVRTANNTDANGRKYYASVSIPIYGF
jgi:hypothetical protein